MFLKQILVSVSIYTLCSHAGMVFAQDLIVNDEKAFDLDLPQRVEEFLLDDYQKAVQYVRDGDLLSAYDHIQKAYQIDPENPGIVADHIAISAWMEKYEEALALYQEQSGVDLPGYTMKEVIRSFRETGDYARSISLSQDFLASRNGDPDIAVGLIYSLIQTGAYEKSSEQLNQAIQAYPDLLRLRSLQSLLYAAQKQWHKFFDPDSGVKTLMADNQDPGVFSDLNEAFYVAYDEAISFARNDQFDEALALLDQLEVFGHKSQQVQMDRIVIMVWQERFEEAVKDYGQMEIESDPPPYFLKEVARAYQKIGEEIPIPQRHRQYISPYIQAMEEERYQDRLQLAFVRSYMEDGKTEEALEKIDDILNNDPRHQEALFLKAEIYDSIEEYWMAVQIYNRILDFYPDNDAAFNLKLRSLMDLGATSLVLEEGAKNPAIVDPVIVERARTNIPMRQIRWEESKPALEEIMQLEEKYARLLSENEKDQTASENYDRVKWDRFLALRKEENMDRIVEDYEKLLEEGIDIPSWVHRAAADAYLYEQKPEQALEIYNELLQADQSFDLQMSVYYTLVELGRYKEAQSVLDRLDEITPAKVIWRGILQDNWQKADIALNRAWLLMYQDRLKEAGKYIREVKGMAPFNTHLRTAEAHNHLYRGWRRQALEDFKMIRTLDDRNAAAHIGYARTLNANMRKGQARQEVRDILEKKPMNKHAQRLKREFDVEEMAMVTFNASYTTEDPGEDEFTLSLRGDQPVGFHHTVFAEVIRRETTQEEGNDVARKVRVGDIWQINNNWRLVGALTGDYEKTDEIGFLGEVQYQPNDHWTFDFGYESNTLDVSSRSRKDGVEADLYSLSATYRMSELFDTTMGVAFKDFSDNNEYLRYFWRTDTALTTSAYWKTRLGTEFNYETFSDQDVDYFSPEETYSFYLVPMVEHTWFRHYEKAWVDRMSLGVGQKWQKDFGTSDVGYVRYEQDHQFSGTKSWLIGTTYSLNEYDGEGVNALNVYTTLRFKF